MGSENSSISHNFQQKNSDKKQKLIRWISSIFANRKKNRSNPTTTDRFIIEYNQNNDSSVISGDSFDALDANRVVFVSLIGLYQSWKNVPPAVLYSSLLLIPLKRKWIYQPSKYVDEIQSHFISQICTLSDIEIKTFMAFLKWKDSQGFVFWMLDDYDIYTKSINNLIHPFWHFLSTKLGTMYDSVTQTTYNPLKLDIKFWENKESWTSKYDTKTSSILSELYFLTMKFNTIQEILVQSNSSLNPVKTYKTWSRSSSSLLSSISSAINEPFGEEKENLVLLDNYDDYDGTINHTQSSMDPLDWQITTFTSNSI